MSWTLWPAFLSIQVANSYLSLVKKVNFMCGIFGIVYRKATMLPNKHLLEETAHILRNRGPDGYGIYADLGIGLVHTRLSLLDLNPRSNQPFWDKDGLYCLV